MSAPVVGVGSGIPAAPEHPVEYRRVYVWELPVRAYHWINAVALVLLCVTGYLIGAPIGGVYASEAYQQYWFGWVRFIHFLSAFVYVFNFAARLYWGFVGNKYAKWNNFFPLKKSQRQEIVDVIKTAVLQTKLHGPIHREERAVARTLAARGRAHRAQGRAVLLSAAADAGHERGLGLVLASPAALVLCRFYRRARVSCLLSRLH